MILKISQYGRSTRWFQLFLRYSRNNWNDCWHFYFCETYGHKIWQEGTSRWVESLATNRAGASRVVTSKSDNFEHLLLFLLSSKDIITMRGQLSLGLLENYYWCHHCKTTWLSQKPITPFQQRLWPPNVDRRNFRIHKSSFD